LIVLRVFKRRGRRIHLEIRAAQGRPKKRKTKLRRKEGRESKGGPAQVLRCTL
jgi:hypothetical protein